MHDFDEIIIGVLNLDVNLICFSVFFQEKVRLKYKLSYSIGGEQFSDVGDIEGIPVQ